MPASPPHLRHRVDAARLRQLRWDAGLTREAVAYRTGLCLRTVAMAEGEGLASRRTVDALAMVLRCPPEELVLPAPTAPPQPQQAAAP